MKVYIGNYCNFLGPYQIAEYILFWKDHNSEEVMRLGKKLNVTPIKEICSWLFKFKRRKISVRIDKSDVWSLDHTLSLIIHPALLKLKENKHGGPYVDDDDVPAELRTTAAPEKKNEWDTDDNWFRRWDYILDEMIWAFGEIKSEDWESQYHSGKHDVVYVPVDAEGNEVPEEGAKLFRMDKGPNDTSHFDSDGWRAHQAKIQNGLRLFAKYYFALWD